ncbi:MAG: HIT domain-containing protein [Planctomycetes bacterium]|nr:HIT domain-containing protein [Planctomycetota bacterium]
MENCIFCKIVSKRLPAFITYESNDVIAFLDINPINPGHTLVCTKEHFDVLTKVPEKLAQGLMTAVKDVSAKLIIKLGYQGFNILQNNDKCAGQIVPHIHFHVIPRNPDDLVRFNWSENIKRMSEEQFKETYRRLTT